jgi:hypothetical protein
MSTWKSRTIGSPRYLDPVIPALKKGVSISRKIFKREKYIHRNNELEERWASGS